MGLEACCDNALGEKKNILRKNPKGKKSELVIQIGKNILEKPGISLQEILKKIERDITIRSLQVAYVQLKDKVLKQVWIPGFTTAELERLREIILDREKPKTSKKDDPCYLPRISGSCSRLTMSRNSFLRTLVGHYEYDKLKAVYRLRKNDVARYSSSRDIPRSFRPPFSEGISGKKGKGGGLSGRNEKYASLN